VAYSEAIRERLWVVSTDEEIGQKPTNALYRKLFIEFELSLSPEASMLSFSSHSTDLNILEVGRTKLKAKLDGRNLWFKVHCSVNNMQDNDLSTSTKVCRLDRNIVT
jgi:hypothetical protein